MTTAVPEHASGDFTIYEDAEIWDGAPCSCCGASTSHISGVVTQDGDTIALYHVQWSKGHVSDHGAHFHFVLGDFSPPALQGDRFGVFLHYFVDGSQFGFTVCDAADSKLARDPLVGDCLTREEVLASPLADEVFAITDAVWLADTRLSELRDSVPKS